MGRVGERFTGKLAFSGPGTCSSVTPAGAGRSPRNCPVRKEISACGSGGARCLLHDVPGFYEPRGTERRRRPDLDCREPARSPRPARTARPHGLSASSQPARVDFPAPRGQQSYADSGPEGAAKEPARKRRQWCVMFQPFDQSRRRGHGSRIRRSARHGPARPLSWAAA